MYLLTRPKACWKTLSTYLLCDASTLAFCLLQSDAVTQKVHMYFLSDGSSDTSILDFVFLPFFPENRCVYFWSDGFVLNNSIM